MNVKLIEGHDGPEIKEREVEVVFEQFQDAVIAILPLAVLQSKANAAHYSEAAASVEENVAQLKVPLHEINLHRENQNIKDTPLSIFCFPQFAELLTCQDTKGSHLNVARVQRPVAKHSQRTFTREML